MMYTSIFVFLMWTSLFVDVYSFRALCRVIENNSPQTLSSFGRSAYSRAYSRLSLSANSNGSETIVDRCTRLIQESLNPLNLQVLSSNDDPNGAHIKIECISEQFEGKSTLQRQRLIYKSIWDLMESNAVHAVDSIVAKTPTEMGLK